MKIIAPCKDCPRREVGCHGTCADYKAFQAEKAKEYAYKCKLLDANDATPQKRHSIHRKLYRDKRYK